MKILMVCLGNICRSPLAEGILREKVTLKGLDWMVDSAGTGAWHIGNLPDPRSIAIAKKKGIDITHQQARQLRAEDLKMFDLVLAMDRSNYQNILQLSKSEEESKKVKLIMNYAYPNEDRVVPDPYWNDDGFEEVFQMLDLACNQLIKAHT